MQGPYTELEDAHEHEPVPIDSSGPHRHIACIHCGILLCAEYSSTREEIQARDVTGSVIDVQSNLRGPQFIVGHGIQRRTITVTTTRCGDKTVSSVSATSWQ